MIDNIAREEGLQREGGDAEGGGAAEGAGKGCEIKKLRGSFVGINCFSKSSIIIILPEHYQ